jgi:hypothetical protein
MTWPWLTGTAVLLFMFIMTVLGVPPTIAGNWQLFRSAVRRVRRANRPAPSELAAAPKDLAAAPKDDAIAKAPAARPPYLPPAPTVILLPSGSFGGGPVPTTAFVGMGFGGPQYALTAPDVGTDTFGFRSVSPAGAGTAVTA